MLEIIVLAKTMEMTASLPAAKYPRPRGGERCQWDGAQRVVINTTGKRVEVTKDRLEAFGKGFVHGTSYYEMASGQHLASDQHLASGTVGTKNRNARAERYEPQRLYASLAVDVA